MHFGEYGKLSSQPNSIFCLPSFLRIFEVFFTLSPLATCPGIHRYGHGATGMLHSTSQQKTLICPRSHGSRSAHYLGFSQIRLSGGKKKSGKIRENPEKSAKIRRNPTYPFGVRFRHGNGSCKAIPGEMMPQCSIPV